MKSHHVQLIALSCLLALSACSKKRTRRAEVVECSSISLDAKGTVQCLVSLYKWRLGDAQKAADARANAAQDSAWNAELPKHRRELQTCMAKRDFNLSSCLTLYYKWDPDGALATADSVTRARLGR